MTTISRVMASIMALSLLGGCVSQMSLDNLTQARQQYGDLAQKCVVGDRWACAGLPTAAIWVAQAQNQVNIEEGNAVSASILAAGLLGVAAGASYGGYHGGYYGYHGYHHHSWRH